MSITRSLSCLFDTDVLLDVVFRRELFVSASAHVLLLAERQTIAGWTTPAAFAQVADYPDWEDQLQYATAGHNSCDYLITRNVGDFPASPDF